MHDSRPPARTPVHRYTMRHSPAAGSSAYCHAATHPPSRPSKSSRTTTTTTTPLASPRPPYSVGQSSPPVRSPARPHDVRAASPNYFGLVVESNHDPRESSGFARDNWSLASGSLKSFAAALPRQVSLEPNADFEAFRRQADLNKGKSFSLPTAHLVQPTSHPAPVRPRPPRWHTHASDAGSEELSMARSVFSVKDRSISKMDIDQDSLHDSAYVSSDSKRNSEASLVPAPITVMPTFESPRPMDSPRRPSGRAASDDRDARMSMVEQRVDTTTPTATGSRADTLPARLDVAAPCMISGANLKELLETIDDSRLLLLDIRSSQSFAQSRIKGALNLCIPTTLLKRPTFNIEKLQQTFQGGSGSGKFAEWRRMDWIIVYDALASDQRDAVTAQNMIKKFTSEGFSGHTAILRGGFGVVQKYFAELVDDGPTVLPVGQGERNGRGNGGLAPVIGGVSLPRATEIDPFFSNIRQNMDLADGVGQFDVARPPNLESPLLPQWLREAASESDHGKRVSDKFLRIEQDEQARMRNAYAAFKLDKDQNCKFQLSGVEKGGKNRYKDILPFDHARVRLQNRPAGACDYVNASHLSASRSHKRYIATQGPLPATFDDFWTVIWEQDVRIIVMLSAESEGGQLKCHPYWQSKEFGAIRLRQLSEKKVSLDIDKHRTESGVTPPTQVASDWGRKRANTTTTLESSTSANPHNAADAPHVLVRKFALSHSAYPFAPIREVTHLFFPAWPDFGTPAQPSHLLALIELANLMQRAALPLETPSIVGSRVSPPECGPVAWHDEPENDASARPMMVHCSAGCGRTGTFCAVDSVIDMLKRQRQARLAGARTKNSQGDVAMVDCDEELSPRTVRAANAPGFFDQAPALATSGTPAPPGSDPHWPEQDTADLIQKTVEEFREQRLSMVQSLRQYVLCYETVLEWLSRTHDSAVRTTGARRRSGSLQQARCD